jgi:UDP-N-acetylmuramyl pentapeptide phosphotransferase/UDP-N-acetylglucosamine-1-phosphate transferase
MIIAFLKTYSGIVLYPVFACALSWVATFLCIKLLPCWGFVDIPGGRHIHKKVVPRGGGLAIIFAFFLATTLFALNSNLSGSAPLVFLYEFSVPVLIVAVVGLLDDRFQLNARYKLFGQCLAAGVVWFMGTRVDSCFGMQLPVYISFALTLIWIVGIINAFNLIDGLDGVAAGLAVVSAGSLAVWFIFRGTTTDAVIILILAGACLGFLRYNFAPARIFLGDTGSMFLGLVFAFVGIKSLDKAATFTSILIPFLAVGVPVFDVFLAFWRRGVRKLCSPLSKGIMDGDQEHLHHRLFSKNNNQSKTAFIMYLLGCFFAGATLLLIIVKEQDAAIVYAVLLVAMVIAIRRFAIVEILDSAQLIRQGVKRPRKSLLLFMAHPFIDFMMICISYLVSFNILCGDRSFSMFICVFAPLGAFLCGSGVYRVYWLRASIRDYRYLGEIVLFGSLFSIMVVYCAKGGMHSRCLNSKLIFFAASGIFFLTNLVLIVGERFFLRYAESFLMRTLLLQRIEGEELPKVLIYGGGLNCRLFLGGLFCSFDKSPSRIIGIIDDENALNGLMVYGYKVLGSLTQIEEIYQKNKFDKVVITSNNIDEDKVKSLHAFCNEKNIEVTRVKLEETKLKP